MWTDVIMKLALSIIWNGMLIEIGLILIDTKGNKMYNVKEIKYNSTFLPPTFH